MHSLSASLPASIGPPMLRFPSPQASEFLHHAFDAFPGKDYCVVTLPHELGEPELMASMTRLPPMAGKTFPEVSGSA